jgi:3-deoxy-D-manno-octulosonic-acid transferase
VITQTGFEAASKYSADVRYLPYELWLPFWIKRQKLLVVSEAELWYMLFFTAKRKGAKTMLINARISDRSYNRYKRFRFFYKKIFENIDQVFAQTTLDKKRLEELGANNIVVCGNIKAYGEITLSKRYEKPQAEVITIASSHEGEEKILLDSFELKEGMKLIVVPRHPERFDEVAKLLREFANQKHLSFSRFSKSGNFKSDITIVDMMGELVNVYAISDIVLLGGSFVKGIGGHNPLEAAYFETKIISGKYYFNQKALYEMVENIEVIDIEDLPHAFMRVKKSRANFDVEIKPIIEAIKSVV